jgi:PDZ domain-containing protein
VIGFRGAVYPIGGIGEKLAAADEAGADVFLVPEGNLKEARAAGDHDLELVVVATFDDAIAHLEGGG